MTLPSLESFHKPYRYGTIVVANSEMVKLVVITNCTSLTIGREGAQRTCTSFEGFNGLSGMDSSLAYYLFELNVVE